MPATQGRDEDLAVEVGCDVFGASREVLRRQI
jgi:hypothetical protein